MNVWHALETLCGERNHRMVVLVEIEDAQEIVAMRKALVGILNGATEKKLIAARKLLGMKIK
jgi:hypothetical protein